MLYPIKFNSKTGYMDANGNIVIEPKYYLAQNFHCGMAAFLRNGKYGFINMEGEEVIYPQFIYLEQLLDTNFYNNLLYVKNLGFINKKGEVAIEHDFDRAWPFFNGYAIIEKNGKYGYINTSGKIVIAPQYPSNDTTGAIGIIGCFGSVYEGLAVIRDFDKQRGMCDPFVIDMSNNIIIKPQKHERMGIGFSEGLLVAENEPNKAGFIDISGEFVIEPNFYLADAFHEELARVLMHNSKYGFINKQGDMVIKARYTEAGDFNEGLAEVIINGKTGFIDKQGNIVIEPKFEAACNFKYGLAYIWEGDKTGYINRQGEFVWRPTK